MNLKQEDYCEWYDEGKGVFSYGVCGVNMRVEGNAYDVCLPNGLHRRGGAETVDAAKQAAFFEFVSYAIKQLVEHRVSLPTHAAA